MTNKDINVLSLDILISKMKKHKYVIYGAGYTAKRFYRSIKDRNLDENFVGFVVSTSNGENIDGYKVADINSIANKNILILIAVHESIVKEIIQNLTVYGIEEYIFITPIFYEFLLGDSSAKEEICLKDIIISNDNLNIAYRQLALEQYYGKCDDGYDIYLKCVSVFSTKETAQARLKSFIKLIKSWDENGYIDDRMPLLLNDYTIIDGAHRISIACYHGFDKIKCKVFKANCSVDKIHNNEVYLSMHNAGILGISRTEVERLVAINERIYSSYGIERG